MTKRWYSRQVIEKDRLGLKRLDDDTDRCCQTCAWTANHNDEIDGYFKSLSWSGERISWHQYSLCIRLQNSNTPSLQYQPLLRNTTPAILYVLDSPLWAHDYTNRIRWFTATLHDAKNWRTFNNAGNLSDMALICKETKWFRQLITEIDINERAA